jgi:hypothetical protein
MKTFIILLPLMIILAMRYVLAKSKQTPKISNDDFWAREREARFARNKDISGLELYTPDISSLPFHAAADEQSSVTASTAYTDNPDNNMPDISEVTAINSNNNQPVISNIDITAYLELAGLETKVIEAAKEPMLDLHEMSNTDIKITYGPANFPTVSKYDQNYMYFVRDVFKWGKYLYDNGLMDDARTVLEYTLSLSDDISGAYTMLANIYRDSGEIGLITDLIHTAEESGSMTSANICNNLRDMINSY